MTDLAGVAVEALREMIRGATWELDEIARADQHSDPTKHRAALTRVIEEQDCRFLHSDAWYPSDAVELAVHSPQVRAGSLALAILLFNELAGDGDFFLDFRWERHWRKFSEMEMPIRNSLLMACIAVACRERLSAQPNEPETWPWPGWRPELRDVYPWPWSEECEKVCKRREKRGLIGKSPGGVMSDVTMTDPVALTAMLVRCPSVTPAEAGALALLQEILTAAGFACTRVDRAGTPNLYARFGRGTPVFAFAGHTDVVPVGDPADWSADPFGATERDGMLMGRGAVDMKSGVAAFVAASLRAAEWLDPEKGSVALVVTGDEEGPATDGTVAILDWMAEHGERADFCVVGEPSSAHAVGDRVRIGRRGSANGTVTVTGRQGHTAYPEQAENPLPALARIAARLSAERLDEGTPHFQPSTLALTSLDVGNDATNVIPRRGRLAFNARFNDTHTSESLKVRVERLIAEEIAGTGLAADLDWSSSGEAFLTDPAGPAEAVLAAIEAATGAAPERSTGGGTSDARFIKDHCPVIEVGLVGHGMHAVDEAVPVADIYLLADLYHAILRRYFGA